MPAVRPRPYQEDAVTAIADAIARGRRRVLVVIATGGGKTILFSLLPHALGMGEAERTLILAHRDELIEQAAAKFARVNPGVEVGIEKAEQRCPASARVCIASKDTLQGARLREFRTRFGVPDLIVTDEAHHATARTYTDIYDAFGVEPGGRVVHVGVTATPERPDGVGLAAQFDEIVFSYPIETMIDEGWSVPIRGYAYETSTSLSGVGTSGGDYSEKQLVDRINNLTRNTEILQAYLDLGEGRPTVVFCANVEHSKAVRDVFAAHGIACAHVDGYMDIAERRRILRDFGNGVYRVIMNASVLTEGYDEDILSCVIFGSPSCSKLGYTQKLGRGTRLHDAIASEVSGLIGRAQRLGAISRSLKPDCIVIDMYDQDRRKSVVSLPVLMGLPSGFDLEGRDVRDVKRRFDSLQSQSAIAGNFVTDAETLETIEALPPDRRLPVLIRTILASNPKKKYVPLDLLRPKPLPQWAQEACSMTWFAMSENTFRLNIDGNVSICVIENALGGWTVQHRRRRLNMTTNIAAFPDARQAFAHAEEYVRRQHRDRVALLDLDASWRKEPSTRAQRKTLRKAKISVPKSATRGDLASIVSQLRDGT